MDQVELALHLDRGTPGSLSGKLVIALRQAIEQGSLRAGDRLPATRDLATRLNISRGTVVTAYEQLSAEGYFVSGQGRGTRVNPRLTEIHRVDERPKRVINTARTVHPANRQPKPIQDLSKRPAWRAAWRKAAASPRLGQVIPPEGDPHLLAEISEHLRAMRGTLRGPEHLLVTAGAREGLSLLLTALGTTSGRELVVGVEDQGPHTLRDVAHRHSARVVLLPTDREGLQTHLLPDTVLDAVIVNPNVQYPSGGLMPLERRQELIHWAKRGGIVIVEDDYDTELRFINAPLPTLASLDDPIDGVVATLGSFSATLSLTLAAGFLVLPTTLRNLLLAARRDLGSPVPPILQIALTELLESGELRRHVARLRRARGRQHERMEQ